MALGVENRGWRRAALGRAVAALLLLASAACQQGGAEPANSGMFGSVVGKGENRSRDSFRASRSGNSAVPAPAAPATPDLSSATSTTPDGRDRRVRISNQSGQTITVIKGSPSSRSEWGEDRIPTTTLSDGSSVIVDFNDNNGECSYDLMATLADGTKLAQRAVNVCQVGEWTVTPDGAQAR